MNKSQPAHQCDPALKGHVGSRVVADVARICAAALLLTTGLAGAAVAPSVGNPKTAALSTTQGRTGALSSQAVGHASHTGTSIECHHCGIVESVQPVRKKGRGTGLGAVTGGVLGGVVGHQLGGGSGKTALTVLGAVGGGFAGNEVEKRARAETVYNVRVRMDDGSVRTLTRLHAPARGERVAVDGQNLRVLGSARSGTSKHTSRTINQNGKASTRG